MTAAPVLALTALIVWPWQAKPPPRFPKPLPPPVIHAPPWRPTGIAIGVTGAMTLGPEHLTAAGADFPLRAVRATAGAMIFQVTTPLNPKLINGNRLCGPRAPTWIVAAPIKPNGLELAVFTGPAAPTGPDAPGVCATYFYNR